MTFLSRLALVASLAPLALACSSSSSAPPSTSSPAPSLRSTVMPTFQNSCSLNSTCHGSPSGIEIYLSAPTSQATTVRQHLLGDTPIEIAMPYVTPGDPANSFLMHKLDGDLESLESKCSQNDCGERMPKGQPQLDQATRDAIRAWIAQGAQDD